MLCNAIWRNDISKNGLLQKSRSEKKSSIIEALSIKSVNKQKYYLIYLNIILNNYVYNIYFFLLYWIYIILKNIYKITMLGTHFSFYFTEILANETFITNIAK